MDALVSAVSLSDPQGLFYHEVNTRALFPLTFHLLSPVASYWYQNMPATIPLVLESRVITKHGRTSHHNKDGMMVLEERREAMFFIRQVMFTCDIPGVISGRSTTPDTKKNSEVYMYACERFGMLKSNNIDYKTTPRKHWRLVVWCCG